MNNHIYFIVNNTVYEHNSQEGYYAFSFEEKEMISKTSRFLFLKGLQELILNIDGNEKVYMAIRPYELHAGNVSSIVGYPLLLCESLDRLGKKPRFSFTVFLNDWEQNSWQGIDIYKFPYDIHPEHSTIANSKDSGTILSEKWQPKIEQEVLKIKNKFPLVTIKFIRNSDLKNRYEIKRAIEVSIKKREEIKKILLDITGSLTLGKEMYFTNALCSECLGANTRTTIDKSGNFLTNCSTCSLKEKRSYEECDFWLHYKILFPPLHEIFGFDITISGADHIYNGDFEARQILYEFIYQKKMPPLKMLFAPLVIGKDGEKMSKSRNNHFYRPLEDIVGILENTYSSTINIPSVNNDATLK